MTDNYNESMDDTDIEERRRIARARKRAEMKRRKRQQMMIRRMVKLGVPSLAVLILLIFCVSKLNHRDTIDTAYQMSQANPVETQKVSENQPISIVNELNGILYAANQTVTNISGGMAIGTDGQMDGADGLNGVNGQNAAGIEGIYSAAETEQTANVPDEVVSTSAILIDVNNASIIAQKDSKTVISPASMTKVLTVLVAAEHVQNLDDPVTITFEDTDFSFTNDCSNVGFEVGETVPVRDLFYGTILPSGADAAMALSTYVAGSQEAFVQMMNDKATELGLSETAHFTNCVGLYDENHRCTVYDMAMIMKAAMDNEFCREVLSTHVYTTTATEQHPEGLILSNWFLRRIEDKDAGGQVLGAKTGYVVQSGNCAVSYALDANQNGYICATANSSSGWRCIYDHVAIYKQFLPQ